MADGYRADRMDDTAANLAANAKRLRGARGLSQQQMARLFAAAEVPVRRRQGAALRPLLPESIPGLDIARMELAPGGHLSGIPHTPGTREYLTCERGRIELVASGERWELGPGDAVVFRGDQRHSYRNLDARRPAVAISVVCFAPVA